MNSQSNVFKLRIVTVDYYVNHQLIDGLDELYSDFEGTDIEKVPTIRIFGITSEGNKACLHVHGYLPYFYIAFEGEKHIDKQTFIQRLANELNQHLNNTKFGFKKRNHNFHVHKIETIKAIPFYGYHSSMKQFLKIHFYDPNAITRANNLLNDGTIMNREITTFEAHIPYLLKFFIDFNLFGMNFINVAKVIIRDREFANENSGIQKMTTCEIEADCRSCDILNPQDIINGNPTNPGIAAMWEEERLKNHPLDTTITPDKSQERTNFHMAPYQIEKLDQLRQSLFSSTKSIDILNNKTEFAQDQNTFSSRCQSTFTEQDLINLVADMAAQNDETIAQFLDEELKEDEIITAEMSQVMRDIASEEEPLKDSVSANQIKLNTSLLQENMQNLNGKRDLNYSKLYKYKMDKVSDELDSSQFTNEFHDSKIPQFDGSFDIKHVKRKSKKDSKYKFCALPIKLDHIGKEIQLDNNDLKLEKVNVTGVMLDSSKDIRVEKYFNGIAVKVLKSVEEQLSLIGKEKIILNKISKCEDILPEIYNVASDERILRNRKIIKRSPSIKSIKSKKKISEPETVKESSNSEKIRRLLSLCKPLEVVIDLVDLKKLITKTNINLSAQHLYDELLFNKQTCGRIYTSQTNNELNKIKESEFANPIEIASEAINMKNDVQNKTKNKHEFETVQSDVDNVTFKKKLAKNWDYTKLTQKKGLKSKKVFEHQKIHTNNTTFINNIEPTLSVIKNSSKECNESLEYDMEQTQLYYLDQGISCRSGNNDLIPQISNAILGYSQTFFNDKITSDTQQSLPSQESYFNRKKLDAQIHSDCCLAKEVNESPFTYSLYQTTSSLRVMQDYSLMHNINPSNTKKDLELGSLVNNDINISYEMQQPLKHTNDVSIINKLEKSNSSKYRNDNNQKIDSQSDFQVAVMSSTIDRTQFKECHSKFMKPDFVNYSYSCIQLNDTDMLQDKTELYSHNDMKIGNEIVIDNQSKESMNFFHSLSLPSSKLDSYISNSHELQPEIANTNLNAYGNTHKMEQAILGNFRDQNERQVSYWEATYSRMPSPIMNKTSSQEISDLNPLNEDHSSQSTVLSLYQYGPRGQVYDILTEIDEDYRHSTPSRKKFKSHVKPENTLNIISETEEMERSLEVYQFKESHCRLLNVSNVQEGENSFNNSGDLKLSINSSYDQDFLIDCSQEVFREYKNCPDLENFNYSEKMPSDKDTKNTEIYATSQSTNDNKPVNTSFSQNINIDNVSEIINSNNNTSIKNNSLDSKINETSNMISENQIQSDPAQIEENDNHNLCNISSSKFETSHKYITFDSLITGFSYKAKESNLSKDRNDKNALHHYSYLTCMNLEIMASSTDGKYPDPSKNSIRAIFYGIYNDSPQESKLEHMQMGIIVVDGNLNDCDTLDDLSFAIKRKILARSGVFYNKLEQIYARDEIELISLLIQKMKSYDPDILFGYEIELFSWGYLLQRAEVLNMDILVALSRIVDHRYCRINTQYDEEFGKGLQIPGRIVINFWRVLRKEINLNIYTYENAHYQIFNQRIPSYSHKSLNDWWEDDLSRIRVVEYFLIRIGGMMKMLDELDFLNKTAEMARVFGITFTDVLTRGSQFRVESLLARATKSANYIMFSPSVKQRSNMRAPEWIPLVLEPESAIYNDPVVVLDFASLYPSIMIAYNYCYSTCVGKISNLTSANEVEFGCGSLYVPMRVLKANINNLHVSPNNVGFWKKDFRKGILPSLLEQLLVTRIMVKQAKARSNGIKRKKLLEARQLGLKLLANVMSGYTNANFSGRMPCIEVADAIISKGRETLERAIHSIENSGLGAKVVYGDTDSIFVLFKGVKREDAFQRGRKLVKLITSENPSPIKLKLEKIYQPCILLSKKRYVGWCYEKEESRPQLDAKGIEIIRRDGCPGLAKIMEKVLIMLFEEKKELIKDWVIRQFCKLSRGIGGLSDWTFAKEFRGEGKYKESAMIPALKIAQLLKANDPRSEPRQGERVPYVIVAGEMNSRLIDLVRRPEDLLENPELRLNDLYYCGKILIPALDRILKLVGEDVQKWYREMPKRLNYSSSLWLDNKAKKGTIEAYWGSGKCALCLKRQYQNGLCKDCIEDKSASTIKVMEEIKDIQTAWSSAVRTCSKCTNWCDSDVKCINKGCTVLFQLVKAKREIARADYLQTLLMN